MMIYIHVHVWCIHDEFDDCMFVLSVYEYCGINISPSLCVFLYVLGQEHIEQHV